MRSVNRRMEIMLEIGESRVKPIAEIDPGLGLANTNDIFENYSTNFPKIC